MRVATASTILLNNGGQDETLCNSLGWDAGVRRGRSCCPVGAGMKPRIKSNSDIFEARGDPWVSDKQGREEYGRNVRTENPEFDRYFAKKAPDKKEPKSEPRGDMPKVVADRRRIASIMNKMGTTMAKADRTARFAASIKKRGG
jgi:hypothetical protein